MISRSFQTIKTLEELFSLLKSPFSRISVSVGDVTSPLLRALRRRQANVSSVTTWATWPHCVKLACTCNVGTNSNTFPAQETGECY